MQACGFRSADGVLSMADDMVNVLKLEYAVARLNGVEAEKEAVADRGATALEEARVQAYKDQLVAKEQDRRLKLAERGKLDQQRAEFLERQARESAEYKPSAEELAASAQAHADSVARAAVASRDAAAVDDGATDDA